MDSQKHLDYPSPLLLMDSQELGILTLKTFGGNFHPPLSYATCIGISSYFRSYSMICNKKMKNPSPLLLTTYLLQKKSFCTTTDIK